MLPRIRILGVGQLGRLSCGEWKRLTRYSLGRRVEYILYNVQYYSYRSGLVSVISRCRICFCRRRKFARQRRISVHVYLEPMSCGTRILATNGFPLLGLCIAQALEIPWQMRRGLTSSVRRAIIVITPKSSAPKASLARGVSEMASSVSIASPTGSVDRKMPGTGRPLIVCNATTR